MRGGIPFFLASSTSTKGQAVLLPNPAASLVPNVCPGGQMTGTGLLATVDKRLLLTCQASSAPLPSLLKREKKKPTLQPYWHVCLCALV